MEDTTNLGLFAVHKIVSEYAERIYVYIHGKDAKKQKLCISQSIIKVLNLLDYFYLQYMNRLSLKTTSRYCPFKLPRKSIPRKSKLKRSAWKGRQSCGPAYDFHILQAAVEQKQSLVKDGVAAPLLTAAALLHSAASAAVSSAVSAAVIAAVSDAVSVAVSASVPACRSRIYPTGISCGTDFL
jgi:hypothetical protein